MTGNDTVIDTYIQSQSAELQPLLRDVCNTIRAALPDVTEKISWQMPTFWQGHNLIHFAAQKNHLGIYPGAAAMEHFTPRLAGYKTSTGAVQFPYNSFSPEQLALIKEIAKDRLVIMVTHNGELAEEYSTRIIKLFDKF